MTKKLEEKKKELEEKTPSEEIDEEEKENSPYKETEEEIELEHEKEKMAKEKKEKDKEKPDHRTPDEKERDDLRCQIDLITYRHRFADLETHLEMEKKRSFMRMEADLDDLEFQNKRRKLTQEYDLLQAKVNLKKRESEWDEWLDHKAEKLEDPVQVDPETGELEVVISDRFIELSGPILYWTAEYITDRIHYFNNQSKTLPIFLIIDYSPGGSVMAGYRIVKTMESSPAPVYVIVQSFAASMAAVITSLAVKSYLYPNAVMLHHQISCRHGGNLKQMTEQLTDLEEWWKRLAKPLADKLGLTLKQLVKTMYENNSDGDWKEFGDKAVELGWADQVVHRIRKTAKNKHPDSVRYNASFWNQSRPLLPDNQLPKLRPFDHYWLHDRSDYYQIIDKTEEQLKLESLTLVKNN